MAKKGKGSYSTPLLVIGALLLLAGLVKVAMLSRGSQAGSSSGSLEVSEEAWDFGTIPMKDGVVTREITLSNTSGEPVTLTRMETSCMCTEVTLLRSNGDRGPSKGMRGHGGTPYVTEEVAPGEVVTLEVAFDPNAHGPNAVGPIRRTVTVATDSANQPEVTLNFSGIVTK